MYTGLREQMIANRVQYFIFILSERVHRNIVTPVWIMYIVKCTSHGGIVECLY